MRPIIAALIVCAAGTADAAGQMTEAERHVHALNGLMHMYAAGSVCFYSKWSFSKQDTDEMLAKIKQLSKEVPQKTTDAMWIDARSIMAEGQTSATKERCEKVREQYAIARPYIFGTSPQEGQAPPL